MCIQTIYNGKGLKTLSIPRVCCQYGVALRARSLKHAGGQDITSAGSRDVKNTRRHLRNKCHLRRDIKNTRVKLCTILFAVSLGVTHALLAAQLFVAVVSRAFSLAVETLHESGAGHTDEMARLTA